MSLKKDIRIKSSILQKEPVCEDMKMITLEKIAHVLRTGENEVQMDEALRAESKKPLEKMLDLAK